MIQKKKGNSLQKIYMEYKEKFEGLIRKKEELKNANDEQNKCKF